MPALVGVYAVVGEAAEIIGQQQKGRAEIKEYPAAGERRLAYGVVVALLMPRYVGDVAAEKTHHLLAVRLIADHVFEITRGVDGSERSEYRRKPRAFQL